MATILLPAVALALQMTGLRRLLGLIEALTTFQRGPLDPRDAARIARFVEAGARCGLPKPTCLVKALVVFALLKRRGLAADLIIGVTKVRGTLEAHAWVRHRGEILVGGGVPLVYAPLVRVTDGRCFERSTGCGELAR